MRANAFYRKERRRKSAVERQAHRAERTAQQQINDLISRPGESRKERARLAKVVLPFVTVMMLAGCITPHLETNGKWTKPAKTEERSIFGTNHGFARLERCDGPAKRKSWWQFYYESDFTNCVMLTRAEAEDWEGDQSRGAGPEIIGGLLIGVPVGIGPAVAGSSKAVSTATAASQPILNIRGHYGRR